jgi:hypothetical protein
LIWGSLVFEELEKSTEEKIRAVSRRRDPILDKGMSDGFSGGVASSESGSSSGSGF